MYSKRSFLVYFRKHIYIYIHYEIMVYFEVYFEVFKIYSHNEL